MVLKINCICVQFCLFVHNVVILLRFWQLGPRVPTFAGMAVVLIARQYEERAVKKAMNEGAVRA